MAADGNFSTIFSGSCIQLLKSLTFFFDPVFERGDLPDISQDFEGSHYRLGNGCLFLEGGRTLDKSIIKNNIGAELIFVGISTYW